MNPDIARKKNEAILKLIAAEAVEESEREYDMIEAAFADEELPAYVDEAFQEAFASFAASEMRQARRRVRQRLTKIALIAVAVLGVAFTGLTLSAEAFRHKVFNLMFSQGDGYNVVIPYENTDSGTPLQDLRGYFPEYLPDGYRLESTREISYKSLHMYFSDGNEGFISIQQMPLESHEFTFDSDGEGSGEVRVGDAAGFWNMHGDTLVLMWTQGEMGLLLSANNSMPVDTAVKIAESMAYKH
jgi:hypothetical protein